MIKKKGRGVGMTKTKTIDELTLMDDYMFAQVMRDKRHLSKRKTVRPIAKK